MLKRSLLLAFGGVALYAISPSVHVTPTIDDRSAAASNKLIGANSVTFYEKGVPRAHCAGVADPNAMADRFAQTGDIPQPSERCRYFRRG